MRRLYWLILIGVLVALWVAYTWAPVEWGIRSTIDGAVGPFFSWVGAAFGGTYAAIVTSPFWQTWVAPSLNSFAIGMTVMVIAVILLWRFKPRERLSLAKQKIIRQTAPEYTAQQVIPEQPTVITETPVVNSPPKNEKKEEEASA